MSDGTFSFRVDRSLKAAFVNAAKAQGCAGAQLLRDFMQDIVRQEREVVQYETWFRNEVTHGIAEADAGEVLAGDEVEARFGARREALRVALMCRADVADPGR